MTSYPHIAWHLAATVCGALARHVMVDKGGPTDDELFGRTGCVESRGASALISA